MMEPPQPLTLEALARLGVAVLHELTEELRELRLEHTALQQHLAHIDESISFYVKHAQQP
jgi:hypothetical protein